MSAKWRHWRQRFFLFRGVKPGFSHRLQSKDTLYLAVRKSGQLIGYCGLLQSFDEADITNVAVEETYRGCGIASRMLERLMELGKARGFCVTRWRFG